MASPAPAARARAGDGEASRIARGSSLIVRSPLTEPRENLAARGAGGGDVEVLGMVSHGYYCDVARICQIGLRYTR